MYPEKWWECSPNVRSFISIGVERRAIVYGVKQIWTTCLEDVPVAEGEDNLGYILAGTDREMSRVATAPEVGGEIRVQETAVPICVMRQMSDTR